MSGKTFVDPSILASLIDVPESIHKAVLELMTATSSKVSEIKYLVDGVYPFDRELYHTNLNDESSGVSGTKPAELCDSFVSFTEKAITEVLSLITEQVSYKFDDLPRYPETLKRLLAVTNEWFKGWDAFHKIFMTGFVSYSNKSLRLLKASIQNPSTSIINDAWEAVISSWKSKIAPSGTPNDPESTVTSVHENGLIKPLYSSTFTKCEVNPDDADQMVNTGVSTAVAYHVGIQNDAATFIMEEVFKLMTSIFKDTATPLNEMNSRYSTPDIAAKGLTDLVAEFSTLLKSMSSYSAPFKAMEREFAKFQLIEKTKTDPITDDLYLKILDVARIWDGDESKRPSSNTTASDIKVQLAKCISDLFDSDDTTRIEETNKLNFAGLKEGVDYDASSDFDFSPHDSSDVISLAEIGIVRDENSGQIDPSGDESD